MTSIIVVEKTYQIHDSEGQYGNNHPAGSSMVPVYYPDLYIHGSLTPSIQHGHQSLSTNYHKLVVIIDTDYTQFHWKMSTISIKNALSLLTQIIQHWVHQNMSTNSWTIINFLSSSKKEDFCIHKIKQNDTPLLLPFDNNTQWTFILHSKNRDQFSILIFYHIQALHANRCFHYLLPCFSLHQFIQT